jgi:iron(III) transport system substrate-binding protein
MMDKKSILSLFIVTFTLLAACTAAVDEDQTLVIYSGRSESLVEPVIQQFRDETGADVQVRYGNTAELAATLLEEGDNSPADLFWAQDPGGLGAVAEAGLLAGLPEETLALVPQNFRSPQGNWVGISGRARVVVYNTQSIAPADLPADIWDFIEPKWEGQIGWAPTNGSFQVMVTAMRQVWGQEKTAQWLTGIQANRPSVYDSNTPIVAAVGAGEVTVGFVNHYYLYRFLAEEGESFAARNYFLPGGGPGSLVMVAGAGVLNTANSRDLAQDFVAFLLSETAQAYFTQETYEYPVRAGTSLPAELVPIGQLNQVDIDLAGLSDLAGTVELLQETGVLP